MDIHATDPHNPAKDEQTSALMSRTLAQIESNEVSMNTLFATFAERSFGGVMILLSILGLIPGVSIIAGLTILLLSLQMIAGMDTPGLPAWLAEKKIKVDALQKAMARPLRYLERLERLVKPRMQTMVSGSALRWTGFVAAVLALVMISPFPLSNLLPAVSLLLISLGILERDGLLVLWGLLSSILSLALGVVIFGVGYELFIHFTG